jgi:hypothetical protein
MATRSKRKKKPAGQLLVGMTHKVFIAGLEEGRVYAESGGGTTVIEHWMLRPTYREPELNGPALEVRADTDDEDLTELFDWGRQVAGTRYIRAICEESRMEGAKAPAQKRTTKTKKKKKKATKRATKKKASRRR